MRIAKKILKEDLAKLEQDKEGNYIIPEGITIYLSESGEEQLARRVMELQERLAGEVEPTEQELIDMGKIDHPYYQLNEELENLLNDQKE